MATPPDPSQRAGDDRGPQPALRATTRLRSQPASDSGADRGRKQRTWHATQATADDVLRERDDLERQDRAMLALRKQLLAARSEATTAREQLARVEQERYPGAVVWGLAVAAFAGWAGWLMERRSRLADEAMAMPPLQPPVTPAVAAGAVAAPPIETQAAASSTEGVQPGNAEAAVAAASS